MKRYGFFGLAAALLLAGCSSLNPFADTPGPKPTELKSIPNALGVKTLWSYSIGKAETYVFQPAVSGNSIFVASKEGELARIDNGQMVWRIKTGKPLSGGVGVDNGLVVVATPKAEVLAFAAANGEPRWTATATSEVLASPAVSGRLVIVRSGDNKLVALDAADGKRKWIYQRSNPPLALRNWAPPVIADRYAFTGFPGGKLVALSLDNGAPIWEGTVASPKGATELERVADVVSVPLLDGRSICGAAYQGRVACFDIGGNGALAWARDISSAPGIGGDLRNIYVSDDKGAVHALDRANGKTLWKQDALSHRRLTAPVAYGSTVVVGDAFGFLHFLNKDTGALVGRYQADSSPIVATPVVLGTAVLVQTSKGGVHAVETQ